MAKLTPAQKDAELSRLLERRAAGERLPAKGAGSVARLEYLQRDKAARGAYGEGGYASAKRARARGTPAAGDRTAKPARRTTYRFPDRTVMVDVPNTPAGQRRLESHLGKMPPDALVPVTYTVKAAGGHLHNVDTTVSVAALLGHQDGAAGAGVDAIADKMQTSSRRQGKAAPRHQWTANEVTRIAVQYDPGKPYKYGSDDFVSEEQELVRGHDLTTEYERIEAELGADAAGRWFDNLSERDLEAIVKWDDWQMPAGTVWETEAEF